MNYSIIGAAIAHKGSKVTPMAVAPLRFTNTGDSDATVAFNDVNGNGTQLSYRKNETKKFADWDLSAITLQPGEYMEVVGDTTAATEFIGRFEMTGTIAASGSIMSIVYGEGITEEQNLVMPYSKLCYYMGAPNSIFYGCTSLTTAPELPATTLVEYCYNNLFYGCTNLTTAPELPATTLKENCYGNMFYGCTSLTTAPELPATTLANSCYFSMFYGCTSLTTAPELPATNLATACYSEMFDGCVALSSVRVSFTTFYTSAPYTQHWLRSVAESGVFTWTGSEAVTRSDSTVPANWTVVNA